MKITNEMVPLAREWARTAGIEVKGTIRILLNGEPLMWVIEADEERGEVLRYKTRPDGNVMLENGRMVTELVQGEVRIELPNWWPR